MKNMKKYLAEFVGTFILVFVATGVIIINELTGALGLFGIALATGLTVIALIYTLSHISGAHINPAVTLAFVSTNRFPKKYVIQYIISQLVGATLASMMLLLMFGNIANLGATLPASTWEQSFMLEAILTFILMFVIMGISASETDAAKSIGGFVIGFVIIFCIVFGGPISGASMNPARSFGPALVSREFSFHWIYWIATILGAVLAALVYQFISRKKPKYEEYGVLGPIEEKPRPPPPPKHPPSPPHPKLA